VKINRRPVSLSDPNPLWTKHPNDCTEEEYREFYRKVFLDYKEPLFWIHLKTDYPFNLRGILYFPKINTEYDALEAQIKLYNNQVFIADNIKEVIPEFLMTLKGVIDCPDLPLNVSRSALQNDGTVKKIAEYISRKMADKLSGMCKTDRENYEKNWDDISPFIKYGCIRDFKFADKMMDYMLFKDLDDKYLTLKEYVEKNKLAAKEAEKKEADSSEENNEQEVIDTATGETIESEPEEEREPEKATVFYVTDEVQQAQYIGMFRKNGKDAVILKHNIDQPFITQLEQRTEKLKFARIDSEVADDFLGEEEVRKEDVDSLTETFRKNLENEKLDVKVQNMKDDDVAAVMTLSEENRRMQDMMKMYGMGNDPSMFGNQETLVLNANHPLVKFVLDKKDDENTPMICRQLYDLAVISHKPLTQEEMAAFVKRSNEIMLLLIK
jgi:molecular chaperone HtpG